MKNLKKEKIYNSDLINSFEMHMGFKNLHNDYYPDKDKRIDKRTKAFGNQRIQLNKK